MTVKIAMIADRVDSADALATGTGAPQGLHVHVGELSAALARAGHEVVVYTRRDDPAQPERVDTHRGYRVVHVPAGPPEPLSEDETAQAMGTFAAYLQSEWNRSAPDVTHAHYWLSGLATQLAVRALGLPTVQTFHSLGVLETRRPGVGESVEPNPPEAKRIRLERLIARGCTRAVATSSEEVVELARMGLPRTRTTIVPSGVDSAHYRTPREPAHSRVARDVLPARRLVTAGPLHPSAGFDSAIEALVWLPGVELLIATYPAPPGTCDPTAERARLLELARRTGVEDRVRLHLGVSREEMPELFRSGEAAVYAPRHDVAGMVALQAMACGRPVIASAVGSMPDTVLDHVTGLLVPTGSPEAIAQAARKILTDSTEEATYGIAARDRVTARYSWDRVAEDTVRVYERCVPVRRTAARGVRIGAR